MVTPYQNQIDVQSGDDDKDCKLNHQCGDYWLDIQLQ